MLCSSRGGEQHSHSAKFRIRRRHPSAPSLFDQTALPSALVVSRQQCIRVIHNPFSDSPVTGETTRTGICFIYATCALHYFDELPLHFVCIPSGGPGGRQCLAIAGSVSETQTVSALLLALQGAIFEVYRTGQDLWRTWGIAEKEQRDERTHRNWQANAPE